MNSKKIFLLVGVCAAAAVILVTVLSNGGEKFSKRHARFEKKVEQVSEKKDIEFDDWINGKFRYRTFYPNWISNNEYIKENSAGSLVKVNIDTEDETDFFTPADWVISLRGSSYSVSKDLQYVAYSYNYTDGYAHYVRTFSVVVFEVATGQVVSDDIPSDGIQKIKWAPSGHSLAFVFEFDVHVWNGTGNLMTVTADGDEYLVFNGISDWLFSIEITDDDALMWWSHDGNYLAFATINQTHVKQFEFSVYNSQQYPEMIKLPYPKPGTPIPMTTIYIFDVSENGLTELKPDVPESWGNEYYLNSAVWRGSVFTPTWKNRVENEAIVENCPVDDMFVCSHGTKSTLSSSTGWLGHYKVSHTFPTTDENEYFMLQDNNKFPHIGLVNVNDDTISFRTSGEFEVTDTGYGYEAIHYYDSINDWLYFTSTELESDSGKGLPRIRHMWRVKGHGSDLTRFCITCGLNQEYTNRCNWVTPSFSPNGSYVVVNCGGSANAVPVSTLHKKNSTGDYDFVRVVENNDALSATLEEYNFRDVEFGTLQLPDVTGDWYYRLFKPPNFDRTKLYPLLVEVYSGPAFQEVEDRYSFSWKDYVASSKDVVVMNFDGRGTGFRGDEIMHMVYKNLGKYEPLDQIAAAKIIGEQNEFIDKSRTAIWGWSYGGYATSRTIGEDSDNVFKCGFAVAPVTEWELYHTIYTERYMLKPENNLDGYKQSSALQNSENFAKHRFSLFHGTRDENVHFQNAAQLSKYLIDADVDFRAFFAADDDHGMNRVPNNYRNIYKMITQQMDICFAP